MLYANDIANILAHFQTPDNTNYWKLKQTAIWNSY